MLARILKDRRRRILVSLYEPRRRLLLARIANTELPIRLRTHAMKTLYQIPRDSSRTRLHTRCTLTGRGRAVSRTFGLSRLAFRRLAWEGEILGLRKSSW